MPPLARSWSPQTLTPPRVPGLCFRTPVPLQAPPQPVMTVAAATAAVAARSSGASSKALAASQPAHSAAIFQQAWQVYHKLLEVDFLEHRCLYTALQELLLGQLADGQARSLLDLGCGDAMQVRRGGGGGDGWSWRAGLGCCLLGNQKNVKTAVGMKMCLCCIYFGQCRALCRRQKQRSHSCHPQSTRWDPPS